VSRFHRPDPTRWDVFERRSLEKELVHGGVSGVMKELVHGGVSGVMKELVV